MTTAEVKWHVVARWRQVPPARAILMTPVVAPWFSQGIGVGSPVTRGSNSLTWLGDEVFGKEMDRKFF